jgi:hypothetical protein
LYGDWNVVQDTSIDTYNIIHNRNQNSREKIEEMLETFEIKFPILLSPSGKTGRKSESDC